MSTELRTLHVYYLCACTCVCVYVTERREKEREKREGLFLMSLYLWKFFVIFVGARVLTVLWHKSLKKCCMGFLQIFDVGI